jgi:enoyl-CoA hydratase/carnithine racemase
MAVNADGLDALGRERRGDVLIITIDRRHRRNALDPETILALAGLLTEATADRGTAVVVVTAAGTESFGSG